MKNTLKLLKKARKIALFSHVSADPDTIGSTLGLFWALKALGKDVSLFCDDDHLDKFDFLGANDLFNQQQFAAKNFDLLVAVDIASLDRVGERFLTEFSKSKNTLRIDHHISGENFAAKNYVKDESACAVIIYEIITKLKVKITSQIATLLYFGICGDTGGFRFNNTDSKTFLVCSKLLDAGADIRRVYAEFFDKKTVPALKLSSNAIVNAKINDAGWVIMKIARRDYEKFGADESEYVGNVPNLYLNCGFKIAAIIKEKSDGVRVSLRSKPEYDCSQIAAKFGGGGHKNAAGISFEPGSDLGEIESKIEAEIASCLKN